MSNHDQNNSIDLANGITNNHILQKKRKKTTKKTKATARKKTKNIQQTSKTSLFYWH